MAECLQTVLEKKVDWSLHLENLNDQNEEVNLLN